MFMFSAACHSSLKPLLLRPTLSKPVYVASFSCLSGVSNAFTKRIQKARAKQYSQEETQTAATTKVIMAQDEVQEFEFANDVDMVEFTEAADGNEKQKVAEPQVDFTEASDGNEKQKVVELQVRMKEMQKLIQKFDEKLMEKEVTYTRVRRRAGVRTRC
jgi:hypothetical protein